MGKLQPEKKKSGIKDSIGASSPDQHWAPVLDYRSFMAFGQFVLE